MVERSQRTLLLAITLIGNVGLQLELLLLDHTDSTSKLIPHAALFLGLISIVLVYLRPTPLALKSFRIVMIGFLAVGLLGVYLHLTGNVEFALEQSPSLSGFPLIWKALRGATPALAPGALAQLGLVGILYAYRHPALQVD